MSDAPEFWTEERIDRLEQALRREQGDAQVEAFLTRLSQASSLDEKRALIRHDLLPVMKHGQLFRLWEGREIPTRMALRDVIQDFLYREQITENIPTDEPDTPEEAAERERLAQLFGQGKPASEIVIDDRGPR
jgi:hypothetical protein